jgi:diaminohydroxyphosphoribosylaminopyrimidine deaminase / 5-amino-6-(5-phosphoribosylamino)uracil reductase
MSQPSSTTPDMVGDIERATGAAWTVVLDAARRAEALTEGRQAATFALAADARHPDGGTLLPVPSGHPDAIISWRPDVGWELELSPDDPRHAPIDLYLPICAATRAHPITVGHLGQSIDGFIATHSGDSQFVTGSENIVHLHRMRAISDAIVVGAGTVAADDPQLTTRHVSGPSPVRVVLDPARRLKEHYKVFNDDLVETLYVCGRSAAGSGETRFGRATVVAVDETQSGIDVGAAGFSSRAEASRFRCFSRLICSIGCRWLSRRSLSAAAARRFACLLLPRSATASGRGIGCSGWVATCCSTAS